jgi:cytochrome b pre-mRNA-processing protein 3
MNLTFPMALYYYAPATAGCAATRPLACLAAGSRFWQAGSLGARAKAASLPPSSERPTMILKLFGKSAAPEAVFEVYRAIVAQSRRPLFYAEWGVPDTVTGRFDMISLHLALLFRRLKGESAAASRFSQAVFDLFFKDMDRSLREMGAGDLAVPKKIRNMGNLFYGLTTKLNEAMERGDRAEVEAVLRRNVFDDAEGADVPAFADYLEAEYARLKLQSVEAMVGGRVQLGEAA